MAAQPIRLPPVNRAAWSWSERLYGDAAMCQHDVAKFVICIPGYPSVDHAGMTMNDIEWDLWIRPTALPNVNIRLRHLALDTPGLETVQNVLATISAMRNGRLAITQNLMLDPAWGAEVACHGKIAMALPAMGGGGTTTFRTDDVLVLGRRDSGVVVVEIKHSDAVSPAIGGYLHEVHRSIRWQTREEPRPQTPPESAFLTTARVPTLRPEWLREVSDLAARFRGETPALRKLFADVWEPAVRDEVRRRWEEPMNVSPLAAEYPSWMRERFHGHTARVRTVRDMYGVLFLWIRALRAAGHPDDNSYFAMAPREIRPEREAELDDFVGWLAGHVTATEKRGIVSWLKFFPEAADNPSGPIEAELVQMFRAQVGQITNSPELAAKLNQHIETLRVYRDLMAMSSYWIIALGRLDDSQLGARAPKKQEAAVQAPTALGPDDIMCKSCGRVQKSYYKFCLGCSVLLQ
jgi:hypothetical protein